MKKLWICLCVSILVCQISKADLAPGYSPLKFTPPAVGSYQLPVITEATDGSVLSTTEQEIELFDLMGDKVVLLSFIYATCGDINGCPLATAVFHKINKKLQKRPELASQLRLLTLSFNPVHDTPKAMEHYGSGFKNKAVDWQFLTTQSEQQLQPILDQYQQSIQKIYDQEGKFTGTFSHILRVYLIDTQKQIRNIYSVSFLHADSLLNDVQTLLQEKISPKQINRSTNQAIFMAGDNKENYQNADYKTQSIAINHRQGQPVDLLANITEPPLGLPAVTIPTENPVTTDKIALGRKLFYDRRLSLNNTFSCAMCHIPEQGFSSNEMATAVGIEGRSVGRNSPTLYNVGYASLLFHDGRESSLERQVWGPLLSTNEMANPSIGYVIDKINSLADYKNLFQQSFGKAPNMLNIGQAIASYQRALNSADSKFDRWYFAKQKNALNASEKRGFNLFTGKGKCSNCHTINIDYALFTDNQLHNTGVGYNDSMQQSTDKERLQIAPGIFIDVDRESIEAVSETKKNDLGQYQVTQNPGDRWKYKTPTLRNISLTAPYMHNGSLSTLQQVLKFYNQGGVMNENLDQAIKPLGLTKIEMDDIIAFLKSLTGSNVNQLVSDAYAAPIGD